MKLSAKWISPREDAGAAALIFRRMITPKEGLVRATLRVSALGLFTARLGGVRIGDEVLAPGWTDYRARVQVKTYDITSLMQGGDTLPLEITVGRGWACGRIGFKAPDERNYTDKIALIALCEMEYAYGREEIATDTDWEILTSPILSSDIYDGETVDLTHTPVPFSAPVEVKVPARLIRAEGPAIREQDRLAPVAVITTPKGERVIDFGQNLAGYVELRVRGPRGARIVLRHGEILDTDGCFYTKNLRSAKCECTYILSGGEDILKPSFTFQGFRYVHLAEYPFEEIDTNAIRAVAVHSDMERTGHFVCGAPLVNQLYSNIIWGQKSNFIDVPTDCPQRNERLGWTGDIQVFCRTATLNFDTSKFFRKWLGDMRADQREDGAVNCFVPLVFPRFTRVSAAWGDAATVVPFETYLAYGNRGELRRCLPMMRRWVAYMRNAGPEEYLWLGGTHFGDWLAKDRDDITDSDASYKGKTPTDLIASVYFAYSALLTAMAEEALGEDSTEHRTLFERVKAAIRGRYVRDGRLVLLPDGWCEGDAIPDDETQTAYVLMLYFRLFEGDAERAHFAERLAALVRERDTHLTTGFVGTPYLLHALSDNGYTELAYDLLLQETAPSWLYSVTRGATTIWEHWDGIRPDGSLRIHHMNSFNHYAYGAVYDWIFGVAMGIKPMPEAPAYRAFTLAPHPDRRLGHARVSYDTPAGRIVSAWRFSDGRVYYDFEVPENSVAYLTLPSGHTEVLTGGTYHFAE